MLKIWAKWVKSIEWNVVSVDFNKKESVSNLIIEKIKTKVSGLVMLALTKISFSLSKILSKQNKKWLKESISYFCDILEKYVNSKEKLIQSPLYSPQRYWSYLDDIKSGKRSFSNDLILTKRNNSADFSEYSINEIILFLNLVAIQLTLKRNILDNKQLFECTINNIQNILDVRLEYPSIYDSPFIVDEHKLSYIANILRTIISSNINNNSSDMISMEVIDRIRSSTIAINNI